MVGSFPSNFVEVLPDDFRPTSRATSPLVNSSSTPSPTTTVQKNKTFRKPFEAYSKAPHYTTAKQPETWKHGIKPRSRENSGSSFCQMSSNSYRESPSDSTRSRENNGSFRETRQRASREVMRERQNSYRENAEGSFRGSRSGYDQTSFESPHRHNYHEHQALAPLQYPRHQRTRRGVSPNSVIANRIPSPQPPRPPTHAHYHSQSHSQMRHGSQSQSPNPTIWYREYSPNTNSYRASSPNPLNTPRFYSPDPMAATPRSRSPRPDRSYSPNPIADHAPSHGPIASRAPSSGSGRAPSPRPQTEFESRSPSPAPSFSFRPYRPGAEEDDSSLPPAPPPHRHVKHQASGDSHNRLSCQAPCNSQDSNHCSSKVRGRHGSRSSYDSRMHGDQVSRHNSNASCEPPKNHGYHTSRAASPVPPSPEREGITPSPLREAMDDVYKELDALGMAGNNREETPQESLNPWSPDSFDMVRHRPKQKQQQARPLTWYGHSNADEGYETYSGSAELSHNDPRHEEKREEKSLPALDGYVERMESRLRTMYKHNSRVSRQDGVPTPPPKSNTPIDRPKSSTGSSFGSAAIKALRNRKSTHDILDRSGTTKTNSTTTSSGNQSTTTQSTNKSLMSATSTGGISATSAASLARKNLRARSALDMRDAAGLERPESPFSGVTYHSSHASQNSQIRPQSQMGGQNEDPMIGVGGGLVQPQKKKRGLFGKIRDMAKTGVASGRNSIVTPGSTKSSPMSNMALNKSFTSLSSRTPFRNSAIGNGDTTPREVVRGGGVVDWVQVRRDVNRSNTISRNERNERRDRCQMLDYPAINPVDEFFETIQGDEGMDGMPVREPINYLSVNLAQVDKNSRFINGLPPTTTAITLSTQYVCRPWRSDVQKLRAIFTWVSEKIVWEDDYEGQMDTRRVLQTKRGCAEEYAMLVAEMCKAAGLQNEVVRGYLKTPGEIPEVDIMPRSNHWWNAVVVDGQWRIMDCCLASPSNPKRLQYSTASSSSVNTWWFLVRPTEACWTHIAEHGAQQHICPPVPHQILLNLSMRMPAVLQKRS